MTTVVISQPMYFPWIGFMAQLALADIYVWLDDAQFSRGSFTNRVQVKGETRPLWMTIPLAGKGAFQNICDLSAIDDKWRLGHRDLLAQQLRHRPFADLALEIFDEAVASPKLVDVMIAGAEAMARLMGITPAQIVRSSELAIGSSSTERVVDIVMKMGGTRYVTGHGAARYLDHERFEAAGVDVLYMDYRPKPWPQGQSGFTPYVTGLDLVASVGVSAGDHLQPAVIGWREFLHREAS